MSTTDERPPQLWRGDDDFVHYVEVGGWLVIYCSRDMLVQRERGDVLRSRETEPTCLWCVAAWR